MVSAACRRPGAGGGPGGPGHWQPERVKFQFESPVPDLNPSPPGRGDLLNNQSLVARRLGGLPSLRMLISAAAAGPGPAGGPAGTA